MPLLSLNSYKQTCVSTKLSWLGLRLQYNIRGRTRGFATQWPQCFQTLFIRLCKFRNTHLIIWWWTSLQNYRGYNTCLSAQCWLLASAWDGWPNNMMPEPISTNPIASQFTKNWLYTQLKEHWACHTSYTAFIGVLGLEGMPPNLFTRTLKHGTETIYNTPRTNGAAISHPSICNQQWQCYYVSIDTNE